MATTQTRLVPDDVVTIKYAGVLARPAMRELAAMRERYPKSYSRERVMEEADVILDRALDEARLAVRKYPPTRPFSHEEQPSPCIVCDDDPTANCEFCL